MKTIMPIIQLKKVFLRDIVKSDAADYFAFGSRFEVCQYMTWGPFKSVEETEKFIEKVYLTRPKNGLPVGYAIVLKKNNQMIGTIDFHTYDFYYNTCEIGFSLSNDYWNQGIMTACLKEMIRLAFSYMNFDHLKIGHIVENYASMRVIKKCGFKYEKINRNAFYDKRVGRYYDIMYYYLDKIDYERGVLPWQ